MHFSPLHCAVNNHSYESLKIMLALKDVNVNEHKDSFNYTPLHFAANSCDLEAIQILLNDPRTDVNSVTTGFFQFNMFIFF